jgi:uncharacterized membrane protein YgcG
MNRFVYALYALVVVLTSTAINSGISAGSGGSPRSWGNGSGFSTGTGSGWSGGGHK